MEDDSASSMRAFVVHPDIKNQNSARDPARALEEAVSLATALSEIEVIDADVVRLPKAQPGLLFGKGKIEELAARIEAQDIGLVLIDGPVTPVQQRNLEKRWNVKLLDRTGLILEIFADRARTKEGVLQVELAALSYQRTRLVRAWTHLERQRGALGFVGGPGETQIEADRRAIDEAMVRLRRQLAKVVKTRELHRKARAKVPYPIVALVGYTNAGKSTLFNRITGASVMAEDMLFATLDPTMRGVLLPTGREIILSDTVGFISDLPTQLVAAFRATLEEVLAADLIVHVRDISHPETEMQAGDVRAILETLGVDKSVPQIEVWNKIDLVAPDEATALQAQADRRDEIQVASALTGERVDALLEAIDVALSDKTTDETLTLDFADGRARAWLFKENVVEEELASETGFTLRLRWSAKQKAQFESQFGVRPAN